MSDKIQFVDWLASARFDSPFSRWEKGRGRGAFAMKALPKPSARLSQRKSEFRSNRTQPPMKLIEREGATKCGSLM